MILRNFEDFANAVSVKIKQSANSAARLSNSPLDLSHSPTYSTLPVFEWNYLCNSIKSHLLVYSILKKQVQNEKENEKYPPCSHRVRPCCGSNLFDAQTCASIV